MIYPTWGTFLKAYGLVALMSQQGDVRGSITRAARGSEGFGYDPVFQPGMSDLTFAEMDAARNNAISHRAHAVRKLARFLNEHYRER